MSQASVKVVYNWRNKPNKSGLYSIHLRITIAGKQKYYPIQVPLKVSLNQWNGESNAWVKNNHPFFFEINNRIREKQNVVLDLIARYYKSTNGLNFAIIFKELKKSLNTDSFNEFFEYHVNHPSENLQLDTLKKYKACLTHLNHFNKKIRFIDLSPELVRNFYDYCRLKENLAGSTIDSYFDSLKRIVRLARQSHHISKLDEESLFEDLHIDIKKSKRTYLTIEEIRRWKNVAFSLSEYHLQRDRDIFLFQVYTGLYYRDLFNLKKEHLTKDHEYGSFILGERYKTGENNIIPLFKFPDAEKIIEKYSNHNKNSPFVFDNNAFLAEQVYNQHLKEIARKADITKNISNKVARHTNAQLWIRLGVRKPIVSKILGHSKEQSTDVYFRISVVDVVEGIKHIDVKTLGI